MKRPALIVQRRFPTYDLVIPTPLSVAEASRRLDSFLSNQQRPRGFVWSDPRVYGEVIGTTFALRRRDSGFGGSMAPSTEGYFAAAETGSLAYVRVELPAVWWAFDVIMLIVVFVNVGWNLKGVAAAIGAVVVLLGIRAGSMAVEASQTASILRKALALR